MEHTRGKWEVNTEDADLYIYAENETIGHIYDYTDRAKGIANARRIVQCCNNFDGLRAAAEEGLHECERVKINCTCKHKDIGGLLRRIERIEKAIAAAEGKKIDDGDLCGRMAKGDPDTV